MYNNSRIHTIIKFIFLLLLALRVTFYVVESVRFLGQDDTSLNISDEEKEVEKEELELFGKEHTQFIIINDELILSITQNLKSTHYFLDKVCLNRYTSCFTPPPELV